MSASPIVKSCSTELRWLSRSVACFEYRNSELWLPLMFVNMNIMFPAIFCFDGNNPARFGKHKFSNNMALNMDVAAMKIDPSVLFGRVKADP